MIFSIVVVVDDVDDDVEHGQLLYENDVAVALAAKVVRAPQATRMNWYTVVDDDDVEACVTMPTHTLKSHQTQIWNHQIWQCAPPTASCCHMHHAHPPHVLLARQSMHVCTTTPANWRCA